MSKKIAALLLSVGVLMAGCGSDQSGESTSEASGVTDGTYRVEDSDYGETGWIESLDVTVENGEITDAVWTSLDEDGNNKLDDENYQTTMSESDGVGPQDFIPDLEQQLEEKQDPAEIEVVTGATGTSTKFQDYAQQAIGAAEEGNTETIVVDTATE